MVDPYLFGMNFFAMLGEEKTAFIKCEPSPLDFTKPAEAAISVATRTASLKIPLREQVVSFLTQFAFGLFNGERTVIAWDIKPFLTYLKCQSHPGMYKELNFNKVYDLKLAESFLGLDNAAPTSWPEAMERLKVCTSNPAAWKVHRLVHMPLATRVLPDIETCGVVDNHKKKSFYPSYTVEGQVHGRMSCHLGFDRCINPHSLDQEIKAILRPKEPHTVFLQFDYRGHEVAVLAWLAKDPRLLEIIADPKNDLYKEIFKVIADADECSDEERTMVKGIFLPVFYGMQSHALSQKIGISKEFAQQIIDVISVKFSASWNWIKEQHAIAEAEGKITDFFGRTRHVENPYLAQHFSIAAPAALICLERLVRLYDALPADKARIVFSIHDGYLISTTRPHLKAVAMTAKEVLEGKIDLCQGLQLRVSCDAGKTLGKMIRMF